MFNRGIDISVLSGVHTEQLIELDEPVLFIALQIPLKNHKHRNCQKQELVN